MNGAICAPRNYSKTCVGTLPGIPKKTSNIHRLSPKHSRNYPQQQYSSVPIHHNCPPGLCRAHTRTGPSIFCPSMLPLCREKCCTQKLAGTQQESLPHSESKDWLAVGLTEEGLPKLFAVTHLSLSADAEAQTGSQRNLEPDFEFPLFFRLCHFPNYFL